MKTLITKLIVLWLTIVSIGCSSAVDCGQPKSSIEKVEKPAKPLSSLVEDAKYSKGTDGFSGLVFGSIAVSKIELKAIYAGGIINIMRPFLTNGSSMTVLNEGKSLLVVESIDNIKFIEKLISACDKSKPSAESIDITGPYNNTIVDIISLNQKSDAQIIVQIIKPFLSKDAKFSLIRHDNSILLMDTPNNIKNIKAIIDFIF